MRTDSESPLRCLAIRQQKLKSQRTYSVKHVGGGTTTPDRLCSMPSRRGRRLVLPPKRRGLLNMYVTAKQSTTPLNPQTRKVSKELLEIHKTQNHLKQDYPNKRSQRSF